MKNMKCVICSVFLVRTSGPLSPTVLSPEGHFLPSAAHLHMAIMNTVVSISSKKAVKQFSSGVYFKRNNVLVVKIYSSDFCHFPGNMAAADL